VADDAEDLSGLIWSVANLLRGDYKQSEYGRVILPFTVLRRLDCLLEPTREAVLDRYRQLVDAGIRDMDPILRRTAGLNVYNTSPLSFRALMADPHAIARNLRSYIRGFSPGAADVLERYGFDAQISRLDEAGLLYPLVAKFADIDLRPQEFGNRQMGLIFEELIRRFSEISSETAGEHFTPPDVIRLVVSLLLTSDHDALDVPGIVRTVYDPVCGTGGMLSGAREHIEARNPDATIAVYGQELNGETYAICRSDIIVKGGNPENIALGNALSQDAYRDMKFDYMLADPPFGVEWKKIETFVRAEAAELGFAGRFGAGLPRINDSSLLFLQHMISKMRRPEDGGSRLAVVFNGSPLFVGAAGSGESEIRRWVLENDLLEGVIALPDQLFYNTGIATYLWILTNRKAADREGVVVLVNAGDEWQKMRGPRGGKRKYIASEQIAAVTELYESATAIANDPQHPSHVRVRVLRNEDFAYRSVVVDRPLKLRFELTSESLNRLSSSSAFRKSTDPEGLAAAVRELIGSSWGTRAKAIAALRAAARAGNRSWPTGTSFENLVRRTIGVRDVDGEVQRIGGSIEPDLELRELASLPLHVSPEGHLKREVHPRFPDAWIDKTKTRVGYEIALTHFFVPELAGAFDHLRSFARLETAKVTIPSGDGDGNSRPYLKAQDLHTAGSSVELPNAPADGPPLTPCRGGDLVGRPGNWRLLPQNFGEAVTDLFVLHPLRRNGRTLCEWLNSRKDKPLFANPRDVLNTQVPVDLLDSEMEDFLEDIQDGRRKIQEAALGILPNVFDNTETDIGRLRSEIRSTTYEARLVAELVRPLEDPIWRAEWSYPYHISALARRYRISAHPAEQKDGLLKLGEGVARVLGILALAEIIAHDGFTKPLRKQFRTGATFGTWLTVISKFADEIATPKLPELSRLRPSDGARATLTSIKDFRNDSHHSHGIRASHELKEDVEKLEPHVVSVITAVNWLSSNPWDWVERCEYLDESSYRIVGLRLRGSHPSWEPFERPSTYPLKPDRVYVDSVPGGTPIDLWPLAAVSLCPECRTRELFLLNQARDESLILRSLEEHQLEIAYAEPEQHDDNSEGSP
jgi:type I restriction enzyme M protein